MYNIADPLKEVEIHPQERHLGSVFHQALVLLFCQEANPVVRQEPGRLETVDRVAPLLPPFECRQDFWILVSLAMEDQHSASPLSQQ